MVKRTGTISKLPCEDLVIKIFGERWRELPAQEIDGAWGIAIVRSILDGVQGDMRSLSYHLGATIEQIRPAFSRLNFNGVFLRGRIHDDRKALNNNDVHAWCQYAGIASGATGNVGWSRQPRPAGKDYKRREGSAS